MKTSVNHSTLTRTSADEAQALKLELEGLRLKPLLERAKAEGVDEHLLEDALVSDNPKETLIGMLMEHMLRKGPAERMATALQGGGEACAPLGPLAVSQPVGSCQEGLSGAAH